MRTGRDGDEFLFGRPATETFTPSTVRKAALKAWTAANERDAEEAKEKGRKPRPLVPIGLHECRHTYVSQMHAAGDSLEEIGDFVGHSSTYMVDHYRHLLEGQRERAAERQERYLTDAGFDASQTPTRTVER